MKEKHIQLLGICLVAAYFVLIIWIYANEPKTFSEVATKATVTAGTYEVDRAKFDEGLRAFRQENYAASRDLFSKADPEKRDAKTQFYIAYTCYRQGWGRISSDDALFRQGIESVNRAAVLEADFKIEDADLKLKTPAELKNELEQGLVVTADDFNPLKLMRERK